MTRPGIEPRSPELLVNTLLISQCKLKVLKLFMNERNSLKYITVCKLFVF